MDGTLSTSFTIAVYFPPLRTSPIRTVSLVSDNGSDNVIYFFSEYPALAEALIRVLQIKRRAGLKNLRVATLSNDAIGYVCRSRLYDEGLYEPGNTNILANGADELTIKWALDLSDRIRQGRSTDPDICFAVYTSFSRFSYIFSMASATSSMSFLVPSRRLWNNHTASSHSRSPSGQ